MGHPFQLFAIFVLLCSGEVSGLVSSKPSAAVPNSRSVTFKVVPKQSTFSINRSQRQSSSRLTSTCVEARHVCKPSPFQWLRRVSSFPSQWFLKSFQTRRSKKILVGTILAAFMLFGPAVSPARAASMVSSAVSRGVPTSTVFQAQSRALGTFNFRPSTAELELAFRLIYAACTGAFVGLERSSSDRPAGVRTMALVGLGACTYTICSVHGFLPQSAFGCATGSPVLSNVKFDPSRMAANIASGVGFIGAGAIHKSKLHGNGTEAQNVVAGLTTAAAIWISAAVGVASALGLYFVGAVATLSTVSILKFAKFSKEEEPGFSWGARALEVVDEENENTLSKRDGVSGLFGKSHGNSAGVHQLGTGRKASENAVSNESIVSTFTKDNIRPIVIREAIDPRLEDYLRSHMNKDISCDVSLKASKVLIEEEQEVILNKNNTDNAKDVYP